MHRKREAIFRPSKHTSVTRVRKVKPDVGSQLNVIEHVVSAAMADLIEDVESAPPESPLVAATAEQPLPFMMAGMTLWGMGVTALVLTPMAIAALAATPLIFLSNLVRSD
jgi:hypothetical protein